MSELIYPEPVGKLVTYGDPHQWRQWPDYLALGLGPEHVPDLIRMATDEQLHWADSESLEVWAPVHAWRALGQLRAEAAIEPLTGLFCLVDEPGDDWLLEEMPKVFALIGPVAIPALVAHLADTSQGMYSRVIASSSLVAIGQERRDARDQCVAALASQLDGFSENDLTLNAFLINDLLDLKAVECVPLMGRAYEADCVDYGIVNWNDVQIELGVKSSLPIPSRRPKIIVHSSSDFGGRDREDPQELLLRERLAKEKAKAKRRQAELARKRNRKKSKKKKKKR